MRKVLLPEEAIRQEFPHLFKNDSTLGGMSMERIANLKLYNMANEFAELYLEQGRQVALLWLMGKSDAEEQVELRDYVKMAFRKRGYVIGK